MLIALTVEPSLQRQDPASGTTESFVGPAAKHASSSAVYCSQFVHYAYMRLQSSGLVRRDR